MSLAGLPQTLRAGDLARLAPPPGSAYFLDVDGTLLEIRPRPEDVIADSALRGLLKALAAAADSALALVSGRRIDDLDRIFEPLILPAAGLHGAEIRFADGARHLAESCAMEAARPKLLAFAARHQGLFLEDKGATLALHFRQRPELEGEVTATLASVARGLDLVVQQGKMVAELKQAGHSKATAIEALLCTRPFAGRTPVFVGDDRTDEDGFSAVNARGGISVRVGPAEWPTAARFTLEDPAALRAALRALAC